MIINKKKRSYNLSEKGLESARNRIDVINEKKSNVLFNKKSIINRIMDAYYEMDLSYIFYYFITINFPELLSKDITVKDLEDKVLNTIESIPLIEYVIYSIEIHGGRQKDRELLKNIEDIKTLVGKPHFHLIIAIRGICDTEASKQIAGFFKFENYEDVKIDYLKTEKDFRKTLAYLLKEGEYKAYKYSKFYESLNFNYKELKYSEIAAFAKSNKYLYLEQINLMFKLYAIILYSQEKVYKKVTNYSYTYLGSIDDLSKSYLDIMNFIENKLYQKYIEFRNKPLIGFLFYETKFNVNYIEFNNGIYDLEKDLFNNDLSLDIKINQERYFNIDYIEYKEPNYWLKYLKLNIEEDNLNWFVKELYYYLNIEKKNNSKKKVLLITGGTSTGKSTLVLDIIANYHGPSNIGLISHDSDSFNLELIIDKPIICIDEFNLTMKERDYFKSIIDGKMVSINRKNKRKIEYINKAPIILACNEDKQWFITYEAFQTRINHIKFRTNLDKYDFNKDLLIKEYPYIYIYIYKLFNGTSK